MIDLARRAVACKGWRWMDGMLCTGVGWLGTARISDVTDGEPVLWEYRGYMRGPCTSHSPGDETPWHESHSEPLPDLTDPATLGCLLALVREAWGMPTGITVSYSSDEDLWGVSWSGATHGDWCGRGKTEAEALVAALESAPRA